MAETKSKMSQNSSANAAMAWVAGVAGWLVPGLGHVLVRRWARAAVYFLCVGLLAIAGLALRGNIFSAHGNDAFDVLGFLADLGAGVFYFVARLIQNGGPDVSHAAGDYGTRLFATAGVLNLLCALDAHEIARGRKT